MTRPELRVIDGDGPEDPVRRQRKFEAAHPQAVIMPPSPDRWRAVFDGVMYGDWHLEGLMDQLEQAYPPGHQASR